MIFKSFFSQPRVPKHPLPGFLVIGVQKGGTSWLWDQLRQHPDIWMPPFKELQFFNTEFIPSHRSWAVQHCDRAIAKVREKKTSIRNPAKKKLWYSYLDGISGEPKLTLEWYRKCFSFPLKSGTLLGDVSPAYCTIPDEGVAYVKELLPDAKIIMVVRNPLERMISHFRMKLSRSARLPSEMTPAQWKHNAKDPVLDQRANYSEYIPRWDKEFGDNMLYLPFDLIRQDPAAFLSRVTSHLGITTFTPKAAEKPVHVTPKHPIPVDVAQGFARRTAAEWAYLQERFPADFIALCKH